MNSNELQDPEVTAFGGNFMEAFFRFSILGGILFLSSLALGQIPPSSAPSPSDEVAAHTFPGQDSPRPGWQTFIFIPPRPLFDPQFGLGVTGIPVQGMWNLGNHSSLYQGGFQINILWRVHPRLTFEIAGEGLFSNTEAPSGEKLSETGVSLGFRVFLVNPPFKHRGVPVLPYLAFGPELNGLFPSIHYENTTSSPGYYSHIELNYPLVFLGGYLGAGVEIRTGHHFAITADVRALAQGSIDVYGHGEPPSARLGVRGSIGVAGYF